MSIGQKEYEIKSEESVSLEGTCPKCKKGELREPVRDRYVSKRYGRAVERIDRFLYRCSNSACNYENIAISITM